MVRISVPVNDIGMEFRMYTIGARVKEERERLEMTIPDFADAAGVKKNTVIDWQKDVSSPPAARLAALASAGLDVQYVVTGVRSTTSLAPMEQLFLERFRGAPKAIQDEALLTLMGRQGQPSSARQIFEAGVGQAIEGDAVFHQPVSFDLSNKK